MRGLHSKYLFALALAILSSSGFASPINVFCYYVSGKGYDSFLLLDAEKNSRQVEANFNSHFSAFVVTAEALVQVDLDCRKSSSDRGLNYDHVEGATTFSRLLYQSYLGFLGRHYPLVRERSVPLEMTAAREVFALLTDMRFSEHPYRDEPSRFLEKYKTRQLDLITTKLPLDPYVEAQFLRDFNRSNFIVLHASNVLYGHKEDLVWDIAHNKFSGIPLSPEQKLSQLFTAIEGAVDSAVLARIGDVQLRKNIALALATRSQAFEFVPWSRVQKALLQEADQRSIMMIANGMGRIDNIITVEGSTLVLESNSGIKVQLMQNGAWDVGLYLCHRELRMDLTTGEMTPEDVSLEQFMML